ncbi:tetraacyldisaccharide 4'-kinase [Selenihalanaerobacter shriftii]|uniref:Tetraacyldisaccharide 4'-kinase n=1 Tax=Selenihalanaerobacter shriftii TaxID=142842 RepID=A0A1T4KY03_9FIRM|nr:tetraacyldisaccharide 4'-kinase [Selenihalanaerobacter shriftii]SJZ47322.1 lipid-A-disaccharide kinase [Selenihalanaerobacter shriftii]
MNHKLENYLLEVIRGHKKGIMARIVLFICSILANIYYIGVKIRVKLYDLGIKKSHDIPCTIISIGNISVGGTGKTPITQFLARKFKARGLKVAILNRGYKAEFEGGIGLVSDGKQVLMTPKEAGDEAFMLAQSLPDVPIIIGSDRVVTGRYAYKHFEPDIILLDDGFQHWKLDRDIDVVAIDATNPFSNGSMIPRGTLREPLCSLERADVFFITKVDQVSQDEINKIRAKLDDYNHMALIFDTIHSPTYLRGLGGEINLDSNLDLSDKKVMSVSGIGNPKSFEQTLTDLGANVVDSIRFEDHHQYQEDEIVEIFSKAIEKDVELIITTEKDAVSMSSELVVKIKEQSIDVKVLGIEVEVLGEEVRIETLLSKMEGRRWKTRK